MRLKKDMTKNLLFGVCAGLARESDIDPTIVRAVFAVATLLGFGLPIIIYIVLAIIMPE